MVNLDVLTLSEFVKGKVELSDHVVKVLPNAHCPKNESFLITSHEKCAEILADAEMKAEDQEDARKVMVREVERLSKENARLRNALFGLNKILDN
jgi:hypothetical protein